jgi:sialate O-acetylesterase
MRSIKVLFWALFLFFFTAFIRPATANVTLASPLSNHMVLQRQAGVPVWGTASIGERVTVTFRGQTKTFTTGNDGKWMVRLDPMSEGGPFSLVVQGANTVTVTDVLVGEVWVGGGQSNMEAIISFFAGPNLDTVKTANYPNLRLMSFAKTKQWQACTPDVALNFSATGFYFGRDLFNALNVPVGIIINAIGGTDIESWLDPASVAADPLLASDTSAGNLYRTWAVPLAPFAIRGVIWYQGENNATFSYPAHPTRTANYYAARFKSLIPGWRALWGQGDFPFYFAQLANDYALQTTPGATSALATVREGQRLALSVPNTAMAVTIDIGDANNIHPKDKWDVGWRLLLPALANLYGQPNIVFSGPMYSSMTILGSTARLVFRYANGLAARGNGAVTGFEVAGADNRWSFANATIRGDTVVVSATSVPSPTQVRYAWADNPPCNLINTAGLPASPFQTNGPQVPTIATPQTFKPLAAQGISVIPCPSRQGVTIVLPPMCRGTDLVIYDVNGRVIDRIYSIVSDKVLWTPRSKTMGFYIAEIKNGDGNNHVLKFMVR